MPAGFPMPFFNTQDRVRDAAYQAPVSAASGSESSWTCSLYEPRITLASPPPAYLAGCRKRSRPSGCWLRAGHWRRC
jgi:hypothetical protein